MSERITTYLSEFLPPSLRASLFQIKSKPVLRARLLLLQDRLRIGWGTARVAVGMSVTTNLTPLPPPLPPFLPSLLLRSKASLSFARASCCCKTD